LEDTGVKSEGEGAMAVRDDTPIHREREWTQEDLWHNPKRNKKMKIDKLGKQQERSCSLPQRASLKSVKAQVVPHSSPLHTSVMRSATIASININGLSVHTRVGILIDFIQCYDLDFMFLQQMTDLAILNVMGYATYLNIGANMRGTAIMARHEYPLTVTNVTSLPTGRAIAVDHDGIRLVNVNIPSGMARRADRECFFNSEPPALLCAASHSILIDGTSTVFYTLPIQRAPPPPAAPCRRSSVD
jgi:hypothetical protein